MDQENAGLLLVRFMRRMAEEDASKKDDDYVDTFDQPPLTHVRESTKSWAQRSLPLDGAGT